MSAMEKMIADMVMKAIPAEVREKLTPENLNAIGARLKDLMDTMQTGMAFLVETQAEQMTILRKLANDDSNNTGQPAALIGSGGSGDSSGFVTVGDTIYAGLGDGSDSVGGGGSASGS